MAKLTLMTFAYQTMSYLVSELDPGSCKLVRRVSAKLVSHGQAGRWGDR